MTATITYTELLTLPELTLGVKRHGFDAVSF